jgi:hypothetical protein
LDISLDIHKGSHITECECANLRNSTTYGRTWFLYSLATDYHSYKFTVGASPIYFFGDVQLMPDLDMEEIYHINLELRTLSYGIQCVCMWVKIGNTD